MKRFLVIIFLYLLMALELQFAVMPSCHAVAPKSLAFLFEPRLLALAGILAGLLQGSGMAMGVAVAASLIFGLLQTAGKLGPSLCSFTIAAYLAGGLARYTRLGGLFSPYIMISLLLSIEMLIFNWIRDWFGFSAPAELPWAAIFWTALWGVLCYRLMAPKLRGVRLASEDDLL